MFTKLCCFLACAYIVLATAHVDDDVKNLQNAVEEKLGLNTTGMPTVEDAEKLFKKKCIKEADEAAYDKANKGKDVLMECVKGLVDVETIMNEVEKAKPTGDMDLVFKKYCDKKPLFLSCVSNFTDTMKPCLNTKEKDSIKIILNITESLASFICYKEGDRIALFVSEGGPECLSDKVEDIQECLNSTMFKYVPNESPTLDNIPDFVMTPEKCQDMVKMQDCIVGKLTSCKEPTPSNIAESLFKFIKQETPCRDEVNAKSTYGKKHVNSASSIMFNSALLIISAMHFV